MPRFSRRARAVWLVVLVPLVALLLAGDASGGDAPGGDAPKTRKITLRWKQPGDVAGFKVYTRHYRQAYGEAVDIGLPPEVDGVYTYEIVVSNLDASWVKITAYNSRGTEGERSNERVYLLDD
ncbi:MAG: hypothetical protein JRH19_14450 [Deltaproteobacteria bacterium]|nr:hypothetical protein [Deltaproteobacteria bacterium]